MAVEIEIGELKTKIHKKRIVISGCSCQVKPHVLRIQGCFASLVATQMCNLAFSAHHPGSKNRVMINSFCFSDSVLTRWDLQSFNFSNSFWSPPWQGCLSSTVLTNATTVRLCGSKSRLHSFSQSTFKRSAHLWTWHYRKEQSEFSWNLGSREGRHI